MRKLTERIANLTKRTKAIIAVIISAIIVAGTGVGFVNANDIHVAPAVKAELVAAAIAGDLSECIGIETVTAKVAKADKEKADAKDNTAEEKKEAKAEKKEAETKTEKKSNEKAKTEQKATTNTASSKTNSTSTAAAAKPSANAAKTETAKPAAHVHNWVERYDNVMVQAAYDEPIYENQPVYETRPKYETVTKYRNTSKCNCGAIGVTAADCFPGGAHAGHAQMAYQEPYTETVQTGTETVQTGTKTVQVGTKHHDAVYQRQVVGYSCACGATK